MKSYSVIYSHPQPLHAQRMDVQAVDAADAATMCNLAFPDAEVKAVVLSSLFPDFAEIMPQSQ